MYHDLVHSLFAMSLLLTGNEFSLPNWNKTFPVVNIHVLMVIYFYYIIVFSFTILCVLLYFIVLIV